MPVLGSSSYISRQITPAATKLIAIGRNTTDFTVFSYFTWSTSTATRSPRPTTKAVRSTTQSTLLRSAMSVSLRVKNQM